MIFIGGEVLPIGSIRESPVWIPTGGGGGITNFNDLSGCITQCLASQITGKSPGDPVTSITDTSTGGGTDLNQTTSTPTYQIVSGKAVVRCSSSLSAIWNTHAYSTPCTVLGIARSNAGGTSARTISSANQLTNNWLLGWWNGAMEQAFFEGAVKLDGSPTADNDFHVVVGTMSGSLSELWWDGSLLESNNNGLAAPTSGIGFNAYLFEPSDCDCKGIVAYDRVLNSTEIGQITTLAATL